MKKVSGVAVLAMALVLVAGCGSSSGSDSSATTAGAGGSGGATTTAGSGGGGGSSSGCSSYTPGKGGVVQVFCDGSGSAKVTIGGKEHTVSGVNCDVQAGYFTVNGGVVVSSEFTGTKPDYVGFLLPEKGGAFSNVTASVTIDGKGYALVKNSGTIDVGSKKGTLTGTAYGDDTPIKVAIDC